MNPQIIDGLKIMLSDMYILYIKTKNFHWNVTGPRFGPLHAMFEKQYEALDESIDEVAERIRALGAFSPGSCSEFQKYSSIKESTEFGSSADEMVAELADDHERMGEELSKFASKLDDLDDEVTAHLVLDKALWHQKMAWMLKAQAE